MVDECNVWSQQCLMVTEQNDNADGGHQAEVGENNAWASAWVSCTANGQVTSSSPHHEVHAGSNLLEILQLEPLLAKQILPLLKCSPCAARAHGQNLN